MVNSPGERPEQWRQQIRFQAHFGHVSDTPKMNDGCAHPELEQTERQPASLRANATPLARFTKSVGQELEEWQADEPIPPIRLFPKVTGAICKKPPEVDR